MPLNGEILPRIKDQAMKSRFITDSQDPSDSFLYTAGAEVYTNFWSAAGKASSTPPASTPVEIPSTPALTSEAVAASGAQSGPTSTVSMTTGGITINLLFDAAAMAAPASFRAGIQQAASLLTAAISDQITVNIKIDYSGTGGGAAAGPDGGRYLSYSTVKSDLINNATPGDTTFNALPGGSSVQGQTNVAVWNAQLKLWGVLGANDTTTDDGSATFATDINSNLLVGVALHELTHAMGRVPYGPPYSSSPDIFDLFRFTSPGTLLIDGRSTATAAYFSVDGGNTKLADFGQTSDPSDFLNSGLQGTNDPFNEFYTGGTLQSLTTVDKEQLDALGFHTAAPVTTVIEAFGSTSLTKVGNYYFLYAGGAGPELKNGGAAVVAGAYGTWTPIGAEQTASGYDVAWKDTATGQYTVWATDSSGNYVSSPIPVATATDAALESIETTFHQDLNGDGVIGVKTTVIEAFGSTSLTEVGNNYFLYAGGAGPELKNGGAAVVAGAYGTWTPIGAEQTAGGYDVAWKDPSTGQYTVWATDSNGNYVSSPIPVATATDASLQSIETTFHQDLNGDGVIGIPAATSPATPGSASANSGSPTFDGTTLSLEASSTFHGQIIGFTGDGTLPGSDQIDLHGVNYNSIHFSFDASTGTLAVSANSTTVELQFLGHYSQQSFQFADDGSGGTLVYGSTGQPKPVGGDAGIQISGNGDAFVFAPNFGDVTLASFNPATDTIQISHSVFANMTALLAATRDDTQGNAIVTDAAHDMITIQHVTAAQLLAHQGDFHFV
jgi:serralysin